MWWDGRAGESAFTRALGPMIVIADGHPPSICGGLAGGLTGTSARREQGPEPDGIHSRSPGPSTGGERGQGPERTSGHGLGVRFTPVRAGGALHQTGRCDPRQWRGGGSRRASIFLVWTRFLQTAFSSLHLPASPPFPCPTPPLFLHPFSTLFSPLPFPSPRPSLPPSPPVNTILSPHPTPL